MNKKHNQFLLKAERWPLIWTGLFFLIMGCIIIGLISLEYCMVFALLFAVVHCRSVYLQTEVEFFDEMIEFRTHFEKSVQQISYSDIAYSKYKFGGARGNSYFEIGLIPDKLNGKRFVFSSSDFRRFIPIINRLKSHNIELVVVPFKRQSMFEEGVVIQD